MAVLRTHLKEMVRSALSRSHRSHSILSGPLRGAMIVTSWHDYPGAILGTTEKPLLEWLQKNVAPGDTWIDVGAHYGYTALALCRLVGPAGHVVAFEPVLSSAGCLARTRELNQLSQLQIVPLGLAAGDCMEMKLLPLVRGMADSTVPHDGWREPIAVVRFDEVWKSFGGNRRAIHGIKIDVQGMEGEVLEGMRQTLRSYRPKLIIEFHRGVDRGVVLKVLASCGYVRHGIPIDSLSRASGYADDQSYLFLSECTHL